MTLIVLHRAALGALPYGRWLADAGRDLVLVTEPEAVDLLGGQRGAWAETHVVPRFAVTAEAERTVLAVAVRRQVSAVVALHPGDQVRAGSLRSHLGLPGQSRDEALVGADTLRADELLSSAGVPVVRRAAAGRVPDLYRAAHSWGYPLVIRPLRGAERPVVAELSDEDDLRVFARDGLATGHPTATAGLTVEPLTAGPRHHGLGTPATDAALAVLPGGPGHPLGVAAVRDERGVWRVDSVRYEGHLGPGRERVRAQAGLPAELPHRESMEAV
ncbi:hypothetical protein [Streptomyces sp. NPDC004232]|uniref:hypothetical protein n=1 Tax=unclassified Streptomyces TaxID=2593676 RepID=UPI0033A8A623